MSYTNKTPSAQGRQPREALAVPVAILSSCFSSEKLLSFLAPSDKSFRISETPFFIFFDSRSGSTYLANLLTKYASIAIPPETNFIPWLLARYKKKEISNEQDLDDAIKIIFLDRKFLDWGIAKNEIKDAIFGEIPLKVDRFMHEIFNLYKDKYFPNRKYFGIKKNYIRNFDQLKKTFPAMKIISLIRDGRAVFKSKKTSIYSVTQKPFTTDPVKAAKDWCFEVNATNKLMKNGEKIIKIYYEDLVSDTEKTISEILEFLEMEQEMQDDKYSIPERYGRLHKNIKKAPDPSKIDSWMNELTKKEIVIYEMIAGKCLENEGYKLCSGRKTFYKKILTLSAIAKTNFGYVISYFHRDNKR